MLELMCQSIRHIIEAAAGRSITLLCSGRRDTMAAILLVRVGIIVEVALIRDPTRSLLGSPYFLLAGGVGEGLRERGGGGGEGSTLFPSEGLVIVETEVEMEAVRVAGVLLLLLLVGHCVGGGGGCSGDCWGGAMVSRRSKSVKGLEQLEGWTILPLSVAR